MVDIKYIGRFGNNIIQYLFGRLLAERNDLILNTPWNHPEMFEVTPVKHRLGYSTAMSAHQTIDDQHRHETDLTLLEAGRFKNCRLTLKGYFQHPIFFDPYKELIKSYLILPAITGQHANDVVVHLRLDDYLETKYKPIIDPSWYADILGHAEHDGKKIYLVAEEPKAEWEHRYFQRLRNYFNFTFVARNMKEDFLFLREFGTILCSNSTFAWMAAWLSDAQKIYTFEKWRTCDPQVQLQHAVGMTPVAGKYIWE